MKLNLLTGFLLMIIYCSIASSCRNREISEEKPSDNTSFFVEGKINADSGKIVLYPFYVKDYFSDEMKEFHAEVKNGKFSISGMIDYPMAFTLVFENIYRSRLFVLEPGNQKMVVNIDENGEVPFVQNSVMKEYRESYLSDYEEILQIRQLYDQKRDSINIIYERNIPDNLKFLLDQEIKTIYNKSDSVLLNYASKNPDSFLALWKLIEIFSFDGYNATFNSTFKELSSELKKSYPASVLKRKLETSGILSIGNTFPDATLLDIKFDSVKSILPKDQEYVLIDFWYSSCRPCIDQFPELSSIYKKYKREGFEIVAISSDRAEDKGKWLEAIVRYELTWNQFLDADAEWCKQMSINKFPTNYLLDSNGVIIAKDLRPIELMKFLEDKI